MWGKEENMCNQRIQSKAADFEHQMLKLQTDYQNMFVCLLKIRTFSKQFEIVWSVYVSFPNICGSVLIWIFNVDYIIE